MNRNSILFGFVLGAIVPVLGYIVIDFLFEQASYWGLISSGDGANLSRRMRTILLLSICTNLIPFNWAKRNYYDATLRGIVFPTLIYVGYWIYMFAHVLFAR